MERFCCKQQQSASWLFKRPSGKVSWLLGTFSARKQQKEKIESRAMPVAGVVSWLAMAMIFEAAKKKDDSQKKII